MENRYFRKFSFGISLSIDIEDYKKIILKYKDYLSSIYFSLPYGDEFHTRIKVKNEYAFPDAKERLIKILKLFKENGIKLEAIINQYNISLEKIEKALCDLDSYIHVDSICCLDEYKNIIDEHYQGKMYTVSSFNNTPLHEKDIDSFNNKYKYDMIVISKELMRKPKLIEKLKKKEIDIKLLINNGCSFNCKGCRAGTRQCIRVFESNLKVNSAEYLYALQSFFPWELKYLFECIEQENENVIDEIKISSRPSTYEFLDKCLQSYINNESIKSYVENSYRNYYLWGRQSNLTPYYPSFDSKEINELKKQIWEISNDKKEYL